MRERFFDASLFADPAWDILLELYLARLEQRRVSISSLCIASAVPATTALRHIRTLVEKNLILREPNPFDGRVAYAELTETAFLQMREYYLRNSELLRAATGG